jgi:CO dehydrogenase maturation factor
VRVAVIGKGGAGKSVIAGTMARLAARDGARVLALDSDYLPGLSWSLGSGPEPVVPPLDEAVGQDENGQWGWRAGVDAVSAAQRFSTAAPDGVRLLQRGKMGRGGSLPLIAASKAFWEVAQGIAAAPEFRDWTLIGDLPAGPFQTARDWAPYAETYLVPVQPSSQSALAGRRVARIARMRTPGAQVRIIANRVSDEDDIALVERWMGEPVFAALPVDAQLAEAERRGLAPIDYAPDSPAIAALRRLMALIEEP